MVLAKACRKRTMLGRIVKRQRAIQMRATFREVSRKQQGKSHEAMPDHERGCRPLSFGQRQEVCSEIATSIAFEGY